MSDPRGTPEQQRERNDWIAHMVLKVVQHIAAIPTAPVQYEPTGAVYAPDDAPYVEQRSDKRRRK